MNYKEVFQTALRDRGYLVAVVVLGLVTVIATVLMITHIQPVDLQVTVRYSSFGITKFYRDKWYYLISFVIGIILIAVLNTALSLRIYDIKGRDMARGFIVLTIATVIIATVFMYGVLRVASLSQ